MAGNSTAQAWKNCAQYRANLRNTFRMLLTQRPKHIKSRVPKILFDLKLKFYFKIIGFSSRLIACDHRKTSWEIFLWKNKYSEILREKNRPQVENQLHVKPHDCSQSEWTLIEKEKENLLRSVREGKANLDMGHGPVLVTWTRVQTIANNLSSGVQCHVGCY